LYETVDVPGIGSTGDERITGDDGHNTLARIAGADRIDARGGADYVYGGAGSNTKSSGDDHVYAFPTYGDRGDDAVDRDDCGPGTDVAYIRKAHAAHRARALTEPCLPALPPTPPALVGAPPPAPTPLSPPLQPSCRRTRPACRP